ncbi:hypothetical protein ACHAXS_011320 [Conticribra weissflogii]
MGNANSKAERSSLEEGTASIVTPLRGANCGNVSLIQSPDVKDIERISDGATNLEMAKAYEPPSSPVKPLVHYIFLVHGWLGNDLEMSYLAESFQRSIASRSDMVNSGTVDEGPGAKRLRRSDSEGQRRVDLESDMPHAEDNPPENINEKPAIIVHSVKCNVGKTHDGIREGGWRLANEITEFIRSDVRNRCSGYNTPEKGNNYSRDEAATKNINSKHVTFSFVGNSLGGLYSRYAISLIPYQLHISLQNSSPAAQINLHPNIFCTTATPHLGVSRHTYLPIPRFAESIIGTGLGETGRDLFRLNSDTNLVGAVGGAVGSGMRRLSSFRRNAVDENNNNNNKRSDCETECIIRTMCLDEKYLLPLRNFRQRVAYANAYGTDFQVPTQTAAFLSENSDVGHTLIAHRDRGKLRSDSENLRNNSENSQQEENQSSTEDSGNGKCPSFIVAILRTKEQPRSCLSSSDTTSPSSELLKMSQSLDALGWKKVFIDVRNRIPVPGISMPAWLRSSSWRCLDDLIQDLTLHPTGSEIRNPDVDGETTIDTGKEGKCVITSKDLARSTTIAETLHFPLGHTVMVANSKSETYSKLNSQGRPVMDKLSEDMIREVLMFE